MKVTLNKKTLNVLLIQLRLTNEVYEYLLLPWIYENIIIHEGRVNHSNYDIV